MRQDNGIKILNYHGELIYKEDIPELFTAHWRPYSTDLVPPGPLIPPDPAATKIPPLAAPKPYRHPNFSGAAAATTTPAQPPAAAKSPTRYTPGGQAARPKPGGMLVGGELDDSPVPEPVNAPKKPASPPVSNPTQSPSSIPVVAVPPVQTAYGYQYPKYQSPHGNPHSPHSPHNNPHSPHSPHNQRKEKPPHQGQQHPNKKGPPSSKPNPSNPNNKSGEHTTNPNNNISEAEKRRRTLIKKMREIQSLKQKQAAGETLLPAQLAKIASESQIQADLDSLPKTETPEVKTPR
jgi:translation initiation factor 2A